MLVHRPADQPAVAQVAHAGEVELALVGGELGDVSDPPLVRSLSMEVALQQIRCRSGVEVPTAPTATRVDTNQLVLAHQPGDAFAADADTAASELAVHAWCPVGAARIGVDRRDRLQQRGVGDRPGRQRPGPPRVEPRPRHLDQDAQPLHVIDVPMVLDEAEAVHRIVSRAK